MSGNSHKAYENLLSSHLPSEDMSLESGKPNDPKCVEHFNTKLPLDLGDEGKLTSGENQLACPEEDKSTPKKPKKVTFATTRQYDPPNPSGVKSTAPQGLDIGLFKILHYHVPEQQRRRMLELSKQKEDRIKQNWQNIKKCQVEVIMLPEAITQLKRPLHLIKDHFLLKEYYIYENSILRKRKLGSTSNESAYNCTNDFEEDIPSYPDISIVLQKKEHEKNPSIYRESGLPDKNNSVCNPYLIEEVTKRRNLEFISKIFDEWSKTPLLTPPYKESYDELLNEVKSNIFN